MTEFCPKPIFKRNVDINSDDVIMFSSSKLYKSFEPTNNNRNEHQETKHESDIIKIHANITRKQNKEYKFWYSAIKTC